jgi:hypothetical protein
MVPLGAEILTEHVSSDGRGAVRRTLRLGVQAQSGGEVAMALILNLSESGLLLETVVKLEVGDRLQIDIPEASSSVARVVWTEGFLSGCEFVNPVPTGAVSAAQLKSPPTNPGRKPPVPDYSREEASFEWTIVMISAVISVVALIIFLAAVALP